MSMKRIIYMLCMLCGVTALAGDFMENPRPAILEVRYNRTEVHDPQYPDSLCFKDEMMLRIAGDMSLFCGVKRFYSDSLSTVNSEAYWALMQSEIEKKNPNVFAALGGNKRSYLYKDYSRKKIVEEDYYDMTPWRCTEDMEMPRWEIEDEVKDIMGYECTKATADFRGRRWIAWFAPEIPVQEGPWKLFGLPGLILEAYDADRGYVFEGCGLRQTGIGEVGKCIWRKSDDYNNVTREEFLKNWWHYKHSDFAAKMRAAFGVGAQSRPAGEKKEMKYDKEETDYPHDL